MATNRKFILAASLSALLLSTNAALAETVVYIHTDALGTPVAITDSGRNVIERSEYEPYGKVLNRPLRDGPGYTGHIEDAETGLSYMQQRYYDPSIGRFLSVDPVTVDGNTGENFSRYWYANNNPYRFTDPDGRQSFGHNDDVPWWDLSGRMSNWFSKTRDYSAQFAFTGSLDSQDVLLKQYEDAGFAILAVQTAALPEMGAGLAFGSKTVGATSARMGLAGKLITEAGELRVSGTVAAQERPYVTQWAVKEAVLRGSRVNDPKGVAGRFMYRIEARFNGTFGKFEVLVNEVDNIVEHAVFKRDPVP